MKQEANGLSRRYVTALREHLKQGGRASLLPALALGRRAVALRFETLELARIHEGALATLYPNGSNAHQVKRAGVFFAEAISPIGETHRTALKNKLDLTRLTQTLGRRTAQLAATNRQLRIGMARRKNAESALKKSAVDYSKLLKTSLHLQEGLRQLTHRVLAAQEDERRKISHELQDEVAQSLLGINVRLLALKKEARTNTKGLRNEIARTQRVVAQSAASVRRSARKFGRS